MKDSSAVTLNSARSARLAATLLLLGSAASQPCASPPCFFSAPGGPYQTQIPPSGCGVATVTVVGGGGGGLIGAGGAGASLLITLPVLPDENLTVWVGDGGVTRSEYSTTNATLARSWGSGGGGGSALLSQTLILAVAGGGGGGGANGGGGTNALFTYARDGSAGGLPSAAPVPYGSIFTVGATTGGSPWSAGSCAVSFCGQSTGGTGAGTGGGPDWDGATYGGNGGQGYSSNPPIQTMGVAGFGLGGSPGKVATPPGTFGGGAGGGGGIFGGGGGSNYYVRGEEGGGGGGASLPAPARAQNHPLLPPRLRSATAPLARAAALCPPFRPPTRHGQLQAMAAIIGPRARPVASLFRAPASRPRPPPRPSSRRPASTPGYRPCGTLTAPSSTLRLWAGAAAAGWAPAAAARR